MLEAAHDRFQEAHYFLHGMETYYHFAEPFRFNLNAFLRPLKEVPQLIQMDVQNDKQLLGWFRPRRDGLRTDLLVTYLYAQRDFIVHRGRLIPKSEAFIGITEGRGLKLGFSVPIDPLQDSDVGIRAHLAVTKDRPDPLELLMEDEESLPCVYRRWVLSDLPDREILDVAAEAWTKVGALLSGTMQRVGANPVDLSLTCRHSAQQGQFRTYDRDQLRQWQNSISASGRDGA